MRSHTALGIGVFLVTCALAFYYSSVLQIDFQKTALLDLRPHPDADEYFAQARAILSEGKPSIQIGYDKLPSRYPPGYPILMLPWLKLLPTSHSVFAPFRTNQSIGFFLLVAAFTFYCWLGKPLDGGLAALLLATLPAFVTFSRSCLSEVSGGAAVVLVFVLVYLGLKDQNRWQIYLAAASLGLATTIRMQLIFFGPLLLAMALFPGAESRAKWFFHSAAALVVFTLAATPLFILNAVQFGGPLRTGYDFWVPSLTDKGSLFSLHNVPGHAAMIWSEVTARWRDFRVANLFGTGTYFVPAFAILTIIGSSLIRPDRFGVCALLAVCSFLAGTASYRFVDGRFYLPLLFLFVAVAELPVGWAVKMAVARKQKIATFVIFGLFILTCIGYPSQSGYKPKPNRSQAWDALHFPSAHQHSSNFEAEQWLIRICGRHPGIVLSDIDPVYLNALLPKPFVAAAMDEKHHYAHSRLWHYGKPEAIGLIKRGLADSLPIYALFALAKDLDANYARLPVLNGYQWVTIENSEAKAVIMRLVPLPPA
jgi:4-amino-4-deoxy-L-arabinose transferase-like glycosyltransferase